MADIQPGQAPQPANPNRTLTIVIYVLQALSFVVMVTGIVAIVMNYVKRNDVRGSWLESHFRWQIRTFWFGLLWAIIGAVLSIIYIGLGILFINAIWIIYRIVRGVLAVLDYKPLPI